MGRSISLSQASRNPDQMDELFNSVLTDLTAIKTSVDSTNTAVTELMADHATNKTIIDSIKQELNRANASGCLSIGTLAISATPEKFKTTTTAYYRISGIQYSKAATDNLVFSAADTINKGTAAGLYYGIWLVQINAAGTVSTKSPSADQVYTSSALAIAALPAVDTGNIALGYILVQSKTGAAWTANTDDLTNGSDCQTATFTDTTPLTAPAAVSASSAATLSASTPTAVGTLNTES